MSEVKTKISEKAGYPPGTLIHIGKRKTDNVKITAIKFNADEFNIEEECSLKECLNFNDPSKIYWINIDG